MKKVHYIQDTKKFWQAHKESRDSVLKDIANRSKEDQRLIRTKMQANHTAVRNSRKVT
jgi:hypothetical protein